MISIPTYSKKNIFNLFFLSIISFSLFPNSKANVLSTKILSKGDYLVCPDSSGRALEKFSYSNTKKGRIWNEFFGIDPLIKSRERYIFNIQSIILVAKDDFNNDKLNQSDKVNETIDLLLTSNINKYKGYRSYKYEKILFFKNPIWPIEIDYRNEKGDEIFYSFGDYENTTITPHATIESYRKGYIWNKSLGRFDEINRGSDARYLYFCPKDKDYIIFRRVGSIKIDTSLYKNYDNSGVSSKPKAPTMISVIDLYIRPHDIKPKRTLLERYEKFKEKLQEKEISL